MITVKTETWKAIDAEIEGVAAFHWEELALDKLLFTRDLDHEAYRALEDAGRLLVIAVRDEESLVGYAVWFVMPHHLHYKSSGSVALADMYFLRREYRNGAGVRMLKESECALKSLGVIRAHASYKLHEPHGDLFAKMGWVATDTTVSKLLVEGPCQ